MQTHLPVLLAEVKNMAAATERPVCDILDGTFGRGGHTRAFLEMFPQAHVLGVDRDAAAIAYARSEMASFLEGGRLELSHHNFCDLEFDREREFDLILLDLGVSSPQLDEEARGFSFYGEGPLDMRMNRNDQVTAADIVNSWSETELIELFRNLGEIQRPGRVVRAIVQDRRQQAFTQTRQLAGLIERVEGWHKKGSHPATRYFMALRLQVNRELEAIARALPQLMRRLRPMGRILVITFHSLEDRIVKNIFRGSGELGQPVVKKVIKPTLEEVKANPRARSAKLRVFRRGDL